MLKLLTPSSPFTLLATVDAFVYLANTRNISSLALKHFSQFASTNSSSFKISSECPTPPVSAAFNSSARSPPIPDTAVLIFHDQFCHRSSPPRALRCYRIPSCSTAVAVTASRSQQFGVPLVTVESCLALLVQRTSWSRRQCLRSVNDVPAFAAAAPAVLSAAAALLPQTPTVLWCTSCAVLQLLLGIPEADVRHRT